MFGKGSICSSSKSSSTSLDAGPLAIASLLALVLVYLQELQYLPGCRFTCKSSHTSLGVGLFAGAPVQAWVLESLGTGLLARAQVLAWVLVYFQELQS
jgi:hypothetical protein